MNRNKRGGRGAWRGNRGGGLHSDGHDDRVEVKRRVTFKHQGRPGGGRLNEKAISALMDDMVMEAPSYDQGDGPTKHFVKSRRGGRGGRRGSPPPFIRKKVTHSPTGWYQIIVPHGQKYEKDFVLRSLLEEVSPHVFVPYYFKTESNGIQFWVDDFTSAEKLQDASRKINLPNGYKMIVMARTGSPMVMVDDNLREKMKNAMGKRYNAGTRALDLTQFHADPELVDVICAMYRPNVMNAIIDIIAKNIPDLVALNLSNNKIHFLDHFRGIGDKLPHITTLYLAQNRILSVSSLDSFKSLQLVELDLTGNPLKDKYKDMQMYVGDVRKRFPKLMRLDGLDLPKPIGFDVEDEKTLPPPKASFLCNPAGSDIVRQFLEQYFVIYDSSDRQPLLNAYHENAMFSVTVNHSQHQSNSQRLTPYLPFTRNVLRMRDLDQKCRQLKVGRLPIVSQLSELPETQHDPQSFGVDLTLFTEKLIHLVVTGLFKERKQGGSAEIVRSFQKSLVIVPSGTGYCIRNEVLHINISTPIQEKSIFVARPAAPEPNPTFVAPPTVDSFAMNDASKQQMVLAMSQQSGMNVDWSRKCLEETQWDFQRAGFIFTELHKQSKIPPEAFIK